MLGMIPRGNLGVNYGRSLIQNNGHVSWFSQMKMLPREPVDDVENEHLRARQITTHDIEPIISPLIGAVMS